MKATLNFVIRGTLWMLRGNLRGMLRRICEDVE